MNEKENKLFTEIGLKNIYVRYFDVDWSAAAQKAVPRGIIGEYTNFNQTVDGITPCVFITNTVFEQATIEYLTELAKKISKKINHLDTAFANSYSSESYYRLQRTLNVEYGTEKYNQFEKKRDSITIVAKNQWLKRISEIQIDCDWTEKSRDHYFHFLREIAKNLPDKKISCTLRLWQFKYRKKAGIPPVNRCMLMCYSTGSPKEYGIKNSIATYDGVKEYFTESSYTLPLDIALPIYSWGVLFRNKNFKGLLGEVTLDKISKDTSTWKPIGNNTFIFRRDTVIGNSYIRYGDEMRVEQISMEDLNKIATYISGEISLQPDSKIALFSWDTTYIKNYGMQNIKNIFSKFN